MISRLAIPVSFVLLIAAGLLRGGHADPAIADDYHAAILDIVERMPLEFDGWRGSEVALPPAAINLLRPNAILARDYSNMDRGVHAKLLVVQCRIIRDMAGHFPPVCYPAHGWALEPDEQGMVTVNGELMKSYVFTRNVWDKKHTITVYNLFALPTDETSVSMDRVREIGSDYQFLPFGAAQVQVVFDESVPIEEHQWVLEQMLKIAQPMIDAVTDPLPFLERGVENGK